MRGIGIRNSEPLRASDRDHSASHGGDDANGFSPEISGDGGSALRAGLARMDSFVPESPGAEQDSRALLRGRERPSGGGVTYGSIIGELSRPSRDRRFGFAKNVPPRGYAWWYVDGISDDGRYGITLIAFVGSVFSPYYFKNGKRHPDDHCALNVCLYGRRGSRWAMTERGVRTVARDDTAFRVGPSRVYWDGDALHFEIDEVATPLPFRVKGRVTLHPQAMTKGPLTLDNARRHRWWPVAPCSRIEVALKRPSLSWSGSGYFDMNEGDEPLEDGFSYWNWSRVSLDGGKRAALLTTFWTGRARQAAWLCTSMNTGR